jgi:hypothetical protein
MLNRLYIICRERIGNVDAFISELSEFTVAHSKTKKNP